VNLKWLKSKEQEAIAQADLLEKAEDLRRKIAHIQQAD
jgi:hypothetical protein